MLGDVLFQEVNKVVIGVVKLGILKHLVWVVDVILLGCVRALTVVLDQRLVFGVVDCKLNNGLAEFGELHRFLEDSNPSLLEGNSPDSFVLDLKYFYFFASHANNMFAIFCFIFK